MFGSAHNLLDFFKTQQLGIPPLLNRSSKFPLSNISNVYNDASTGRPCYNIEFALAGYSKDEITLDVVAGGNFNLITLAATSSKRDDNVGYLQQNIAYRDIYHNIMISANDHLKSAEYNDGILKIVIERVVEDVKPQRITIK